MKVSIGNSHTGVSEGTETVAGPVSVTEAACSFLAEVSSDGMLDRDGYERKVAVIEREDEEVQRKADVKMTRLKAKREAAVRGLGNAKAFRVTIEQLAGVQKKISGVPAPVKGL